MMMRIKKIIAMISAMLLLAASTLSVQAASPSDAKDSVVMIAGVFTDGRTRTLGTGFAIGEPGKPIQYIATNCHVATAELKDDKGNVLTLAAIQVYFSAAANNFMNAELYWKNVDKDLAVLKLPEPTREREAMVFCPMNKVNLDDNFSTLGFPWTAEIGNDFMKYDKSDISITKGGISKQARIGGKDCYLLDLDITNGNSGGPLVNSKGEVVGVNSFGYVDPETQKNLANYAIAIDELMRNIDRNVIPYTVTGEITQLMLVYIICGIAAAVVVVVLIILLVKKGGKKTPVPAAAAGAYVNPVQSQTPVRQGPSAFVRGVKGHFAGKSFNISGILVFGRNNSKCSVAFPLDAPGISGTHCEVAFESGVAYLKDLGSSYGTFLANGTKLTANQPVRMNNGDVFYLAGEENSFEVRIG